MSTTCLLPLAFLGPERRRFRSLQGLLLGCPREDVSEEGQAGPPTSFCDASCTLTTVTRGTQTLQGALWARGNQFLGLGLPVAGLEESAGWRPQA